MTTKKVQIFYASIGSGHLIAAQSIFQAIKILNPDIEIELQDIFRHTRIDVLFQEIMAFLPSYVFPKLYTRVWKHGSFKWLYNLSCSFGPIKGKILRNIQLFSPNLLICTHTFPCTVISNWKQNHTLLPLIAVATDQFIHPYWPIKNIDAFIAPNIQMKKELIQRGFEKERIFPFGIPISPKIKTIVPKSNKKKRLKVIVLAGSFRVAPYLIIHKRVRDLLDFLESHQSDNILWQFVFGAALALKTDAEHKFIDRKDVEIFDFPKNIQKMMANSDFIFTKPGGLTVAEALALKKPLVLLSAGAGQERENTEFVVNSGYGILLDKKTSLLRFVENLLYNSQSIHVRFTQPSKQLINSAQQVAHLALRLMDES